MTKLYGILDEKNNTLYNDYIRASKDVRELIVSMTELVNDKEHTSVCSTYPNEFALVCVGQIEDDHITAPLQDGKPVKYYKIVDLEDLVENK